MDTLYRNAHLRPAINGVSPVSGTLTPLARLIQDHLRANGWSYADLARACDLPRATAYALANSGSQRSTNRIATLEKLATGLGVPLATVRQAAAESAGYSYDEVDLTPSEVQALAALAQQLSPAKRSQLLNLAQMFSEEDNRPKRGKK